MKIIEIKSLSPGQITELNYYSVDGELLIGKNITLSKQLLDALLRRNIFEVYIKDKEPELEKIIDAKIEDMEKLLLDWNASKAISLFPEMEPGEKGYELLSKDKLFAEIDRASILGEFDDCPSGSQIKSSMKQLYLADRSKEYKSRIGHTYSQALNQIEWILNKLINTEKVDYKRISQIVEYFLETFINDRNVLLAVSSKKSRDEEFIFNHTLNVCLLSMNIAAAYGYSEEQVVNIGTGSILHDLGMLLVPPEIRFKKGRLTRDEWFEVRKHPLLGLYLTEKLVRLPESIKFISYQAHERDNGKGYPKQRSSRFIHNYAKIIQIADIFEALSSPRSYREAHAPYKSLEMLIKMSSKGFICNDLLKAFLSCTSLFPVGSLVELDDGRVARVIFVNETRLNRPVISVLKDSRGKYLEKAQIYQLDLSQEKDVKVVRSLPFDSSALDVLDGF